MKLVQKNREIIDNSGSCALILLVFENKLYVANTGDSRCVISLNNGKIRKDVKGTINRIIPMKKKESF